MRTTPTKVDNAHDNDDDDDTNDICRTFYTVHIQPRTKRVGTHYKNTCFSLCSLAKMETVAK